MRDTTNPRPAPVGIRLPVPAAWEGPIAEFIYDREAAGRPATSRRAYKSALEHIARRVEGGPYDQTRATLRAYVVSNPDWSVETRRARRSTLVAFYDWAQREEMMADNPARQLPKVRATQPHPKPVPEDVYQLGLQRAQPRERLMLRLAHEIGMRRDEVARCHTSDIWEDFGGGWVINVHGKGNKTREMPLPESVARELQALPAGYVFPGRKSGHLSAEYVGKRTAELLEGTYTLHTLRHSYATRLYRDAGDIVTVQEALGHASPATTMRYVVTDNRDRLRALMEGMSRPQALRPQAG